MHQPHPDPRDRDDLPSWVAVAWAPTPPASGVGGRQRKKYFCRSHLEKSANNHRRFDGAFVNGQVAGRSPAKPQQLTPKMKRTCKEGPTDGGRGVGYNGMACRSGERQVSQGSAP
jgi:hypothetical protein